MRPILIHYKKIVIQTQKLVISVADIIT